MATSEHPMIQSYERKLADDPLVPPLKAQVGVFERSRPVERSDLKATSARDVVVLASDARWPFPPRWLVVRKDRKKTAVFNMATGEFKELPDDTMVEHFGRVEWEVK